ncbi:MAG: hypothetical protein E7E11_12440, partial [Enterococcus faecalis]|nr:hypothetical protein [Enterococcus faecalis]
MIKCFAFCFFVFFPLWQQDIVFGENIITAEKAENGISNLTDSLVFEGVFGTSNWTIDSEGVLHIHEGTFDNTDTASPWVKYKDLIKKVIFEGKVIAGARSNYLFKDLSNILTFENMKNFDMSKVRGGYSIFENCSNLTNLDLSQSNARFVASSSIFSGCTNLKSLNVSNVKFDINSSNVFTGDINLSELTIDSNFGFTKGLAGLPDVPNNATYSGKWVNVGTGTPISPLGSIVLSSSELSEYSINSKIADTYVWQKNIPKAKDLTVIYRDTEGKELSIQKIVSGNVGENYDVSTEEYR